MKRGLGMFIRGLTSVLLVSLLFIFIGGAGIHKTLIGRVEGPITAPLPCAGVGSMTELDTLTPSVTLRSMRMVIDPTNDFIYVTAGTGTVMRLLKIDLSTFTQVGNLSLTVSGINSVFTGLTMDNAGTNLYAGGSRDLWKVELSSFTQTGFLTPTLSSQIAQNGITGNGNTIHVFANGSNVCGVSDTCFYQVDAATMVLDPTPVTITNQAGLASTDPTLVLANDDFWLMISGRIRKTRDFDTFVFQLLTSFTSQGNGQQCTEFGALQNNIYCTGNDGTEPRLRRLAQNNGATIAATTTGLFGAANVIHGVAGSATTGKIYVTTRTGSTASNIHRLDPDDFTTIEATTALTFDTGTDPTTGVLHHGSIQFDSTRDVIYAITGGSTISRICI